MSDSTQWFHGSKAGWTLEWRGSVSFQSSFLSMWKKRTAASSPFFFLSEYLPVDNLIYFQVKLDAGVSFGTRK